MKRSSSSTSSSCRKDLALFSLVSWSTAVLHVVVSTSCKNKVVVVQKSSKF